MRLGSVLKGGALAAASAGVGYFALGSDVGRKADADLFEAMNGRHGPAADRAFDAITELGSIYAAGAAAGMLAALGRPRHAARAFAAAGTTWVLGQEVKKLVDRPRPYDADPEGIRAMIAPPRGTSWPSSHPAVLSTFTTVAARELRAGPTARAGLNALSLAVAASRVYLRVHYPSDVVSGMLMGRAIAAVWPRGRG
ncbi:MAG: phosphatase PAP2 family protein [Actinomycetota bacterium]|nr:phosphatase PAP2 family protein [Actinomycetota bacterium]MDH5223689.1 phosphatase PAP2 family protein [Actinomycetota bacterium]MDH5312293.1 phosphatase PAP2 family protein [Actinomycetota bacterium]